MAEDAESLPLGNGDENSDQDFILGMLKKPKGSQETFRKRWIEFDCQKGVHHGKYATYENKKRIRVPGGYLGRFNKVQAEGQYGTRRVQEFKKNHTCHFPKRFRKDLDECGVRGTRVKS